MAAINPFLPLHQLFLEALRRSRKLRTKVRRSEASLHEPRGVGAKGGYVIWKSTDPQIQPPVFFAYLPENVIAAGSSFSECYEFIDIILRFSESIGNSHR